MWVTYSLIWTLSLTVWSLTETLSLIYLLVAVSQLLLKECNNSTLNGYYKCVYSIQKHVSIWRYLCNYVHFSLTGRKPSKYQQAITLLCKDKCAFAEHSLQVKMAKLFFGLNWQKSCPTYKHQWSHWVWHTLRECVHIIKTWDITRTRSGVYEDIYNTIQPLFKKRRFHRFTLSKYSKNIISPARKDSGKIY